MSKRPTPKKRQPTSSSARRYKTFQNSARKKLMQKVDGMKKLSRIGKVASAKKRSASKVTKIKA